MVERGELLEYAEFAGNFYGTPSRAVAEKLAAGIPVLLEIELHGARQVRASAQEALLVFLAPPSWDELVRRLVGRGTEPADVIASRLATRAGRARGAVRSSTRCSSTMTSRTRHAGW